MIITTPALVAAFRLATSHQVRRHEWQPRMAEPKERLATLRREAAERRELVLALLTEGHSWRAIARRLKVSRTTISNHVRALKAEGRWQP